MLQRQRAKTKVQYDDIDPTLTSNRQGKKAKMGSQQPFTFLEDNRNNMETAI